jgi:hypothetical protein
VSTSRAPGGGSRGWCSLRLRFRADELALLRSAEQLHGFVLADRARPDTLRDALALARVGKKLAAAAPDDLVALSEHETALLLDATASAIREIQRASAEGPGPRSEKVARAFPELGEHMWRAYAIGRELDELQERVRAAVTS